MRKLKVLQVIQGMGKGGAERYAADLSIALQKAGHTVRLVSFENRNAYSFLTDQLDYRYIHTYVQPSISSKHIYHTDEFDAMVAEFKPDIIHSHLFKAEIASRNTIFPNVTYVTTCHNNMPQFKNWKIKNCFKKETYTKLYEKNWMIKKYRKCENNFIAISNDTSDFFKTSLPIDLRNNVTLIHNAIDFERFNKKRNKDCFPLFQLKLIYVARFVPIKNHSFLLNVLSILVKTGISTSLVLLGEGPEMENIKIRIIELGLENNVELMGNVDNVEDYLANANFYVHPAIYEPFGLVIVEAMAAGLPPICLNGGGNVDLIENDKNGYVLNENLAERFAEIILELFHNPMKYKRISQNAIISAASFDMSIHVQMIIEYYLENITKRKNNYSNANSSA